MGCCGRGLVKRKRTSFAYKVKEATKTAKDVVKTAITSGKVSADENIVKIRLQRCKTCRHLVKNRCQVCGCFMNVKAGLKAASCPLRKW